MSIVSVPKEAEAGKSLEFRSLRQPGQ
jgi:hypothetical protein